VAVGDFNCDGRADLAVANEALPNTASGNVSVLLGDGSGGFAAAVNFTPGHEPESVAVGDFNGDGRADLAVANYLSNNVSVLLGDGSGGFTAPVNFAAGEGPVSVAVGDFNGDGRADLAVANEALPNTASGNVSVLLGDGSGGFAAAVNFGVGAFPYSVAVGDFNGDGKQDLAVANAGSANVSVLLGDGSGAFAAAVNFAAGDEPSYVAVGDFNGDGRADLAVANDFSNYVSVLLNTTGLNPPVVGDQTFSVNENSGNGTVVGTVVASDPDAGQTLSYQITAGNASGAFAIDAGTGQITVADPAALDYETTPPFTLTVQVTDNGSPALSTSATVTINLNNVNEAPVNSVPSNPQAVAKNGTLTFSVANGNAISIADPDVGTTQVQVSLTVLHGNLTLAGTTGLTFLVGDGRDDGTMTFRGTIAAINAALDGLRYAPAQGYIGADALTITTDDLGSGLGNPLTDTDVVAIRVKTVEEQAAELQARVNSLRDAGVLNRGQANSLNVKLNLQGNNGDVGRVQAFLHEVDALRRAGVLTQEQADSLSGPANDLLLGLK
jgi:hypothetical protein